MRQQIILTGWTAEGEMVARLVGLDEDPRTIAKAAIASGRFVKVALSQPFEVYNA